MEKITFLDELSGKIKTALKAINVPIDDNLKVGYDEGGFTNKIRGLSHHLDGLNIMVTNYCLLLDGKKSSLDTVREIYNMAIQSNDLKIELKKLYLNWEKISIPNVPIKIDKLIEVYDFPAHIETAIARIVSVGCELKKHTLISVDEFYDKTSGTLVITEQQKDDIHEKYARFITEGEVLKLFWLHMLCEALNGLSAPPYSFKNLPEIDFRLMNFIRTDEFGRTLVINLEELEADMELSTTMVVGPAIRQWQLPK